MSIISKTVYAAAIAGTAVAAMALAEPPTAAAFVDPAVDEYLYDLTNVGGLVIYDTQAAVDTGYYACDRLAANGHNIQAAIQDVYWSRLDATQYSAMIFVTAADVNFC